MDENRSEMTGMPETAPDAAPVKKTQRAKVSPQIKLLTATGAVVIAIVLVLNILLGALPSNVLEFDTSSNDLYTLTTVTKRMMEGLKREVEVILVAQEETIDERATKFLEKYCAGSDNITLIKADPVKYPSVLDTYGVESGNILVRCPETGKSRTIAVTGFDGYGDAMMLYDYSAYYYSGALSLTSFDGEGAMTSAVIYVTSDTTNVVGVLTGHGEAELGATITSAMGKANYTLRELDLLKDGGVPEDCGLVMGNLPATDLADDELEILQRYLRAGGKMMLVIEEVSLDNWNALLADYGLELEDGYLADTKNYYENYASNFGYYCFGPELSSSDTITSGVTGNTMLLYPRGMSQITPVRRGSVLSAFMTSSDGGVCYADEDHMKEGKFTVGAAVTEELDSGKTSRLTVISAASLVEESVLSRFKSLNNSEIFMNALGANFDGESAPVSIAARSMSVTYNTFKSTTVWSAFFIGVIPAAFIICGIVTWTRRRKR